MQDTDGNRITAGYTGGQLTSLTASSGQYIDIAYNAAGLISSITDSAGRTTTYNYDPTNTYLISVNGFNGQTTNYTYDTTSGDAAQNALETITIPGGTHEYFTYDSLGRLAGISQDGGAEPETFAYSLGQGHHRPTAPAIPRKLITTRTALWPRAWTRSAIRPITRTTATST